MVDQVDRSGTRPRRGRSRYPLGCAGVVVASMALALIVAISSAVLIPVPSCACTTPLDLVVQNFSQQDASVSWSQPGLFGTPLRGFSGGAVASGCRTLSAGLRGGAVEVSINAGGVRRTFQLHVRDALALQVDTPATIVIGADGHVADPIYGEPVGGWRQDDTLC
jgi:hypothetical protein